MTTMLNDGHLIPVIGVGTYKMPDDETTSELVAFALHNGYRAIDCASYYANQKAVGRGISDSELPRERIFVTSKVWRDDMGYDSSLRSAEQSLRELGLDYLDLLLLHWPTTKEENIESWRALCRLRSEGLVRSIGVSNFDAAGIQDLIDVTGVVPGVNQIEFHPGLCRAEIVDYCRRSDILVEAWSPLARGRVFDDATLRQIAERHGKTVAQICLRWELQKGVRPIPKSSSRERILQNIDIFDFDLTPDEMQAIDRINGEG